MVPKIKFSSMIKISGKSKQIFHLDRAKEMSRNDALLFFV